MLNLFNFQQISAAHICLHMFCFFTFFNLEESTHLQLSDHEYVLPLNSSRKYVLLSFSDKEWQP